jgi:quinolinate synthase
MQRAAPDKELIAVPVDDSAGCEGCNQCPHMKLNTLEKIYVALRDLEPRIEMNETLRAAAAKPLLRMLAV